MKNVTKLFLALILVLSGFAMAQLPHGLKDGKPYDGTELTFLICCPGAKQFVAWRESVEEFKDLTGIDVYFTDDPLGGLREKIVTESLGNPGSWDTTIYFETWGPSLANFLEPISSFSSDWEPDLTDYPNATIGMATLGDDLYGIPARSHVMMLYYRQDVLDDLGLSVPTTWDEVTTAAKAITEADNDMYGITMNWAKQGGGISLIPWTNVLKGYGATQFDADYKPTMNSPEAIAATEMYANLLNYAPPGAVTYNEGDARTSYGSGEAAMVLAWSWAYEVFQNPEASEQVVIDNTGFTPVIPGETGPTGPVAMTWPMAISASSENKEAALEWVKWMTNPELDLKAVGSGQTVVANRLSSLYSDGAAGSWGDFSKAMGDAYSSATPLPVYLEFPEGSDILETALTEIAGGANVADILNDAADDIDKVMKRSGRY